MDKLSRHAASSSPDSQNQLPTATPAQVSSLERYLYDRFSKSFYCQPYYERISQSDADEFSTHGTAQIHIPFRYPIDGATHTFWSPPSLPNV